MREEMQIGSTAMTKEQALQAAGRAWCGEKTKHKVMDVELAKEFAKILQHEVNKAVARKEILDDAMIVYRIGRSEPRLVHNSTPRVIPFAPEQIVHLKIGDDRKSFQP